MRFFKPSAETTPASWRDWATVRPDVAKYAWADWREVLDMDTTLGVRPTLYPCKWCSHTCRLQEDVSRTAGMAYPDISPADAVVGEWWQTSNPWLNTRDNTVEPGLGSSTEPIEMGPEWRSDEPLPPTVEEFYNAATGDFDRNTFRDAVANGDKLATQAGSIKQAPQWAQEHEMRKLDKQVQFANENSELFGEAAGRLLPSLRSGVMADYVNIENQVPRPRGLPRKGADSSETEIILGKLRRDIVKNRMFICSTATIDTSCPIQATPTTTVEKKNADRTISLERRAIADVRQVNMGFGTRQYYIVKVPSTTDVARTLIALVRKRPGIQIVMAKRGISSAFRLLSAHPKLAQFTAAGIPGRDVGLPNDVLLFTQLCHSVGMDPHRISLLLGAQFRLPMDLTVCSDRIGGGLSPSQSLLDADDGIFTEWSIPGRLEASAHV